MINKKTQIKNVSIILLLCIMITALMSAGTWTSAEGITLDHVNVSFDTFYFNNTAYVYVVPLDSNDNIVNISDITIKVLDAKYKDGAIITLFDNSYKKLLNVSHLNSFTNITNSTIKLEVFVTQSLKTINETVSINIKDFEKTKLTFDQKLIAIEDYWMEHWVMIIVIVMVLLIIIILFKFMTYLHKK